MASLWLTAIPNEGVHTLKMLRDTMRVFDDTASVADAQAVIDVLKKDGFAHIGDGEERIVAVNQANLILAGMKAERDLLPEDQEAKADEASTPFDAEVIEDDEFSSMALDVATVLLAQSQGNPLTVCTVAIGLARITDDEMWDEVVQYMIRVFPWLEDMLAQRMGTV
jgi:hypothetical protein